LLGCVLNMVSTRGGRSSHYYYSYYYSHYYADQEKQRHKLSSVSRWLSRLGSRPTERD
jgi:hypothetical protein